MPSPRAQQLFAAIEAAHDDADELERLIEQVEQAEADLEPGERDVLVGNAGRYLADADKAEPFLLDDEPEDEDAGDE